THHCIIKESQCQHNGNTYKIRLLTHFIWNCKVDALLLPERKEMNLKQIRAQKGLTVQQLADLAELPKRTVENILRNGDCLVSNAIKLADALGVTLDELCRDNPEQTETE
ncbi:MAG: helix-turn-helix transcriptional regulator, partial [Ruminococcus sp.]|nr:helix-turn-helix transcriptional regulator [Ruminococcus sp.]